MQRLVSHLSLGFLIILLAACASAPKKPAPLSPAQVSKLKSMQLPSRLPVPVKGVDRDELKRHMGRCSESGS